MVKVKKDEDDVDGSVDVCGPRLPQARNTKIANLPLLRISTKVKWLERQGFTSFIKKMMAGCSETLDQTSAGTVTWGSIMDAYQEAVLRSCPLRASV